MKTQSPKPRKLAEVAEEYNDAVVGLCLVCEKPVKGSWYGRYGDSGVCSKTCEQSHQAKPKYGEHTSEAFNRRFNL